MTAGQRAAKALMKAPILFYRYTFAALTGGHCRYLPTCSEYASEAIEKNGAWKGGWLTLARLARCRPGGGSGHDPVLDLTGERHPFAPWRYGRWAVRHDAGEAGRRKPG